MLEIKVFNSKGEEIETASLSEDVLGGKVRKAVLKNAILMFEANRRRGTASTKTRSEVRGSTRKPYRQKGTGRARTGSIRNPIWKGGGTTFGPKPRDYSYSIPKKAKRAALKSALLSKFKDDKVLIIDELKVGGPKTKVITNILKKLDVKKSCLIGTKDRDVHLFKSCRNIPNVKIGPVKDFNAYDVLRQNRLILTKDAFMDLQERFKK